MLVPKSDEFLEILRILSEPEKFPPEGEQVAGRLHELFRGFARNVMDFLADYDKSHGVALLELIILLDLLQSVSLKTLAISYDENGGVASEVVKALKEDEKDKFKVRIPVLHLFLDIIRE